MVNTAIQCEDVSMPLASPTARHSTDASTLSPASRSSCTTAVVPFQPSRSPSVKRRAWSRPRNGPASGKPGAGHTSMSSAHATSYTSSRVLNASISRSTSSKLSLDTAQTTVSRIQHRSGTAAARGVLFHIRDATLDATENYWDADVVYQEDPKWPGAETFTGADAVRRRFLEYLEVLGRDIEVTLEDVALGTDGMVAVVTIGGRTTGSGAPFEHRWGYHFRMRGPRVAWFRAYYEPEEAFAAAGS